MSSCGATNAKSLPGYRLQMEPHPINGVFAVRPKHSIPFNDAGHLAFRGPWVPCPYGTPGDRLWVRETWGRSGKPDAPVKYRADNQDPRSVRWRPSIHMPRWASRLTLGVIDVRVERLQAISERDAIAEGVEDAAASENVETFVRGFGMRFRNYDTSDPTNSYCVSAKESFRTLWESIHGADGWARNPWVWVVSFRVVMP